jgi:hypothetical protein
VFFFSYSTDKAPARLPSKFLLDFLKGYHHCDRLSSSRHRPTRLAACNVKLAENRAEPWPCAYRSSRKKTSYIFCYVQYLRKYEGKSFQTPCQQCRYICNKWQSLPVTSMRNNNSYLSHVGVQIHHMSTVCFWGVSFMRVTQQARMPWQPPAPIWKQEVTSVWTVGRYNLNTCCVCYSNYAIKVLNSTRFNS